MKKLIYISVIVCLNIILFGSLLKVLHWPGASILLFTGMTSLAFLVLPAAFINSYKAEQKWLSLYVVGFICSFMFIISALFKIQHWPGSGWLLIIALPLPIILFLPVFYYHQRKSKVENHSNLIGVMFLLVYYSLFSAIMSINVSGSVISNFVENITQTENTKQAFEAKHNADYEDIDSLKNKNQLLLLKIGRAHV